MPENIMEEVKEEITEGIESGRNWKEIAASVTVGIGIGIILDSAVKPRLVSRFSKNSDDDKPERRKVKDDENVIDVEAEEVDDE